MKQSYYFTSMADPRMAMEINAEKKKKSKDKANDTTMMKALSKLRMSSEKNLEK